MDKVSCSSADILVVKHQLLQKKKVLNCVDLQKLPDKGKKIINQIEELESTLKNLSVKETHSCCFQGDLGEIQGNSTKEISITQGNEPKSKDTKSKHVESSINCEPENISSNTIGGTDFKTYETATNQNLTSDKPILGLKSTCSSDQGNFKIPPKTNVASINSIGDMKTETKISKDFISFSDFCTNTDLNKKDRFPKSPAFSQWRGQPEVISRRIQLTEAKSLAPNSDITFSANSKLGSYNTIVASQTNEKTIKQLQACLQTCPVHDNETDPQGLKTKLMVHQKKALTWLLWRETQVPSGGIFADDMGLGKTLSVISLILKQIEARKSDACSENPKSVKGTLIVCVASIIHQWKSEIERHCKPNALDVFIHHGKSRENKLTNLQHFDVIITTYGILMREYKAFRTHGKLSIMFDAVWERIVLDEAHTIKNYKSQTAECIFALNSSKRWAVTGTPIHNDLKDLYSLLKFLRCAPFDEFKLWKKLISDYSESSNKRRDMLVKSILLRRCKNDVDENGEAIVNLTKKNILVHSLHLSEIEEKIYLNLHRKAHDKLLVFAKKHLDTNKNSSMSILVLLLRLQQCCNHISLLGKAVEDDIFNDSVSDLSSNMMSLNLGANVSDNSIDSNLSIDVSFSDDVSDQKFKSTKIQSVFEELDKVLKSEHNDKSIIISQWVSMLDIVALHLDELNIDYHVIKGSTKAEDRESSASNFNYNPNSPKVMLLSLKAGGVGLNLIGANHMFVLDLHWNPALENQACDRIYRVGQLKDVYIHKFICKDTIEEKIFEFQKEKCLIASHVLSGPQKPISSLSLDDFKVLFNI